jgi:hypothetical protein
MHACILVCADISNWCSAVLHQLCWCALFSSRALSHWLISVPMLLCVVMWGGRSFGLHTPKVALSRGRGHTYCLHRTHMGCLTWTVKAHVL